MTDINKVREAMHEAEEIHARAEEAAAKAFLQVNKMLVTLFPLWDTVCIIGAQSVRPDKFHLNFFLASRKNKNSPGTQVPIGEYITDLPPPALEQIGEQITDKLNGDLSNPYSILVQMMANMRSLERTPEASNIVRGR